MAECVNSCLTGGGFYTIYKSNGKYYELVGRESLSKDADYRLVSIDDGKTFYISATKMKREFKLIPGFYSISVEDFSRVSDECDPIRLRLNYRTKCTTKESRGGITP